MGHYFPKMIYIDIYYEEITKRTYLNIVSRTTTFAIGPHDGSRRIIGNTDGGQLLIMSVDTNGIMPYEMKVGENRLAHGIVC